MQPGDKYTFYMVAWENAEGRMQWTAGWSVGADPDTLTLASNFEQLNEHEMVTTGVVEIPIANIHTSLNHPNFVIPEKP